MRKGRNRAERKKGRREKEGTRKEGRNARRKGRSRMEERKKEWMDGWMNEWMNECMNEWMNNIHVRIQLAIKWSEINLNVNKQIHVIPILLQSFTTRLVFKAYNSLYLLSAVVTYRVDTVHQSILLYSDRDRRQPCSHISPRSHRLGSWTDTRLFLRSPGK